jgi:hypothetical protein
MPRSAPPSAPRHEPGKGNVGVSVINSERSAGEEKLETALPDPPMATAGEALVHKTRELVARTSSTPPAVVEKARTRGPSCRLEWIRRESPRRGAKGPTGLD